MNITEFCNKYGIIISDFASISANPNNPDWEANHYEVTLRYGKKRYKLPYSMGFGLKGSPKVDDVMDSLRLDCSSVEWSSFEEWCSDFDYDSDSRKAEKLYNTCRKQAEKMKAFLGDLYDEFLETEGL